LKTLFKVKSFLYNEQKATKSIKVVNVAMSCERDKNLNRERIRNTIEAIMRDDPDAEMVIFGEMILGWYKPGSKPEYHHQISESISGPTTKMLATLAKKHNVFICYGISACRGEELSNAQILLTPKGEIQAVHRKKVLQEGEIQAKYRAGSEMVTITDIKGVKTGMVICSDTASFRTMWELIKLRLDLIIISLADPMEDDFVTKFQARLFDTWVVTANRFGKEEKQYWPGQIVVTDPMGEIRDFSQDREQYLINRLNIVDKGQVFRDMIRNIWVKMRLVAHVVRNLKRALSYI
jgi:predicted amidohydrolase